MKMKIGTASKEINSTAVPSLTTEMDIQIKDGCSMISPVILLRDEVYDSAWNYVYIEKWGRYYFLHDAVIQNGIWSIQCAIDVLASWRSYILGGSAYVSRSASSYSNFIPDSTWSHTSTPSVSHTDITISDLDSEGCFLFSTVSNDGQAAVAAVPSVSCYVMTAAQLKNVCNYMFNEDFYSSVTSGSLDTNLNTIAKTVFNPFQYVVKCMWVPFPASSIPQHAVEDTVNFGWWESTIHSHLIFSHKMSFSFSFTQGTYGDWTDRSASWTTTTLYIPGFSQITLNPDFQGQTLTATVSVDLATGQAGLFIKNSAGALVQSATGQLGADVQLSGLYEDVAADFGTAGSAVQTLTKMGIGAVSNVANNKEARQTFVSAFKNYWTNTGNAMANGSGGSYQYQSLNLSAGSGQNLAETAVQGAQAAIQPAMSTIGANGTRAIIENNIKAILTVTKFNRYEDIHERLGGKCCKVISPLSNLSGYTEVVNPHINCPATSEEISQINTFLSGGFYIE